MNQNKTKKNKTEPNQFKSNENEKYKHCIDIIISLYFYNNTYYKLYFLFIILSVYCFYYDLCHIISTSLILVI